MKQQTIATPPGKTIQEQLQEKGMSCKEFAAGMEPSGNDLPAEETVTESGALSRRES